MSFRLFSCLAAALLVSHASLAGPPVVGSPNEAVIEPPVPHPNEPACVVTLVTKAKFGADAVNYSYTPPSACPGPWGVVTLSLDIGLNPGIQYDRSGLLTMAGVPLWFGTTAEPSPTLAPHWHVEKDVTDYSALYTAPQTGFLQIANYYNAQITSTITATAWLTFYPPTRKFPAPATADVVLPLPAGGGTAGLSTGADKLSITQALPKNILHAVLDVYLQGQQYDEFWYTCVPNVDTTLLESCGGGALREGEISIDGTPAGVAPVYPWIFTGGIDPNLWTPIPGVQTLDFKPFHADLSPFAGVLSQGARHTIAVSVFGADQYFSATGALRLFLDPSARTVSGGITSNTLTKYPTRLINRSINRTSPNDLTATVDTSDTRDFTITGTVDGSRGLLTNTVTEHVDFHNNQAFSVSPSLYDQRIDQRTAVRITSVSNQQNVTAKRYETLEYPLGVVIVEHFQPGGNIVQDTRIDQQFLSYDESLLNGTTTAANSLSDSISTQDSLALSSSYNIIGNSGQASTATYLRQGTSAPCFKRTLGAAGGVLTSDVTGC